MSDVRAFFPCVVCGLSIALFACGGSTAAADSMLEAGSDGAVDAAAASSGFNPGVVGSIVASLPDAGAMATARDAGGPIVTPQVVDGCTQLCTKEQAANCPSFGSVSSCMVGCELLARNPSCSSDAQNLFACVDGAAASCDSSGNATFASCGLQEIASGTCFLVNSTDPMLQAPCTTYCAAVSAAKCPNDNPSGCVASCQILGNLFGCDVAWTAYVSCANGAALSCGGDGKASAADCISQAASFWECAASALVALSSADAGG